MTNIIITHKDVDGIASGAIVLRVIGDARIKLASPRSVTRVLSRISEGKGEIYILDIAVNSSTIHEIAKELSRLKQEGWKIVWIDHHPWPKGTKELLGKYVDKLIVEPSPSAASLVMRIFAPNDQVCERIALIGDDADSGSYSMDLSNRYYWVARDPGRRIYLIKALAEGNFDDEKLKIWAEEQKEKDRRLFEEKIREAVEIRFTKSGKKYALIDLRPKGGPGTAIARELAKREGIDFSLVIYSCDGGFGLYRGKGNVRLKRICEKYGGGGHEYACGGKLKFNFIERILCSLFGRRYRPRKVKNLIKMVEESV